MLRPCDLRFLATYSEPQYIEKDDGDTEAVGWAEIAEIYVAKNALSAKEIYYRHNPDYEVTHIIRCPFYDFIRNEGRFEIDGVAYRIASVIEKDGPSRELEILAVSDGN